MDRIIKNKREKMKKEAREQILKEVCEEMTTINILWHC